MHKCYHQTSQFLFDGSGPRIKQTLQPTHVSETMQKEGNKYAVEGPMSILIFWESSDAKWKGGRAGRGKLEGTAMCSIIALSRSLLLPLPHVLPNVMLLCKDFLHIETLKRLSIFSTCVTF